MQRIDKQTVELTPDEVMIHEAFNTLLGEGKGMTEARDIVQGDLYTEIASRTPGNITPDFWDWLVS